jgi:hypothetical protein
MDEVAVNYVEREDLDQNASLANATGEVARREMVQMQETKLQLVLPRTSAARPTKRQKTAAASPRTGSC